MNRIVGDSGRQQLEIVEPLTVGDAQRVRALNVRRATVRGFGQSALPDLSVLDGLIDELNVVTLNVTSDASVATLPQLRSLTLQSYARNRINVDDFPLLERLWTYWRPGAETALDATALRELTIAKYPYRDLQPVQKLARLERLGIRNGRIETVDGIESLTRLARLELVDNRRLADISALRIANGRITDLRIQDCPRLASIDALEGQLELEGLQLTDCGDIRSIVPLSKLPRLRRLWLYGTTNIVDGDVDVLLDFPALEETAFANRRHYSMRREDIEAELAHRQQSRSSG